MLRSITFIKWVHTAIFLILSVVLAILLYEVVFDRISTFSWIALTIFLAEGLLLLFNGWRCPLTSYAEELGSDHGQVTDIFLPKWFADRVFLICGILFALACLLLIFRLFF